ncbi:hypothetical protein Tco_1086452 [Tanacetum coccineum]
MSCTILSSRLFSVPFKPSYIISASSSKGDNNNSVKLRDDWRQRSKPIPPGGTYPAKDHCSKCGLCDTLLMSKMLVLSWVTGCRESRSSKTCGNRHINAYQSLPAIAGQAIEHVAYIGRLGSVKLGAQWTGIVTTIAIEMLKSLKKNQNLIKLQIHSYAYESPPLADTMDYLRCDHTLDCNEELPPIHSADLNSPATSLEANENGFLTVKSKREKLIRLNVKRASCT